MANQYETSTMTRARRPVTSSNCRGTIVHTHFCAFLLGTALVASCSAAIPDVGDCESDEQCVDLFGDGFVCGSNGFCQSVPQDCGSNAECQEELGFGGICTEGQCTRVQPIPRCTKTYPEDLWTRPESYRQAVVFGSVMDRSSAVHVGRENGMEVAAKVIDDNRGFAGRLVGIVFCDIHGGADNPYADTLERPDAAVACSDWLVNTLGVPSIIGASASSDTQLIYQTVIEPAIPKAIIISPSSATPDLTYLDTTMATDARPGFLWRTAASSADQATVVAEDMATRTDVDIQSVAIVREMGGLGEGVARAFIEDWTARGRTTEQFIYADANAEQLRARVAEAGKALESFDAVFFIGQTNESTDFITLATDDPNYPDDFPIYFPQTGANAAVFASASSDRLFEGVRAANQSVPTDTFPYDTFSAQFKDRFGTDPVDATFSPHSYDAVWLSALGAVWSFHRSGKIDGLGIAQGIRQTVGGATTHEFTAAGWGSAVLKFKDGHRIDVVGASGKLDFDPNTEETQSGVELLQGLRSGVYERISTTE